MHGPLVRFDVDVPGSRTSGQGHPRWRLYYSSCQTKRQQVRGGGSIVRDIQLRIGRRDSTLSTLLGGLGSRID